MTRNVQGRGSLSGEVADALSELAARKAVFSVDEFASAIGRPKNKVWRVLHALAQGRWLSDCRGVRTPLCRWKQVQKGYGQKTRR